jgi:hypothetical protein
MLAELEKHFSNLAANKILKQFWVKKDEFYQFLEQESFGNLYFMNDTKVQVKIEENSVRIIFSGDNDRGGITETFTLVRKDEKQHYLISEYSFSI